MVLLLQCNVKPPLARERRRLSGIALTSDLGRDLGVPLLHQRVSKATYQVDQQGGWREQLLCHWQDELHSHSLPTIHTYTMQSTSLPSSITDELDNGVLFGVQMRRKYSGLG